MNTICSVMYKIQKEDDNNSTFFYFSAPTIQEVEECFLCRDINILIVYFGLGWGGMKHGWEHIAFLCTSTMRHSERAGPAGLRIQIALSQVCPCIGFVRARVCEMLGIQAVHNGSRRHD